MRKLFPFIVITIIFCSLHSCVTTVDFVTLDIRKPAHIAFKPGTNKILIVDNSFKPKVTIDSTETVSPSVILKNTLIDSIRPVLLNNIAKFMNEEGLFYTIEVYPYYPRPLYIYYENDSLRELPLEKEDIQDICFLTDADALISLDFMDIDINLIGKYLFLTESTYTFRSYSALGDTLASPITDTDTIALTSKNRNMSEISRYLINENTILSADRILDSFIPKWETQERVLFREFPNNTKKTAQFINQNAWQDVYNLWEEAFNKTDNKKKKIRYASNITLACEYMDNIELAHKWINTANDLLSAKDKSELAIHIRYYKGLIDERAKNAPILKKQLDLSIKEELPTSEF